MEKIKKKNLKTGFSLVYCGDSFALCGQPQEEDLKELKKELWTDIINLREESEIEALGFNWPQLCQALNFHYHHIPLIVDGCINKTALKKIHGLLSENKENIKDKRKEKDSSCSSKKFIIHCASGFRSALAFMAHLIFSAKYKNEELETLGAELGLSHSKGLNQLLHLIG